MIKTLQSLKIREIISKFMNIITDNHFFNQKQIMVFF